MDRRKFLFSGFGAAAAMVFGRLTEIAACSPEKEFQAVPTVLFNRLKSKYSHRLPKSDQNYKRSKNYIEDDPIPGYNWASDEAYEAFQDMKYGVRIHWGLYSIWHMSGESWPFLGNRKPAFDFAKRQEYNQLYKTWNPAGFDADKWMELFSESGMKMFAEENYNS
jgi:alpha-L-fucosidase